MKRLIDEKSVYDFHPSFYHCKCATIAEHVKVLDAIREELNAASETG